MKRFIFIVVITTLMISSNGCMKTSNSKEQEKVGIRGQITTVLVNDSKIVTAIMVEGKVESDTMYDKAMVSINKSTIFFKGNTDEKVSASELKKNMKVEIVFEGEVAESYPVQGKAKTIRAID